MDISSYQAPVTGEDFFDREAVLNKLKRNRKNIALLGIRRGGKTSLLQEFRQETRGQFIVSYTYLPFEETLPLFLIKYFNNNARAYLEFKGRTVSEFNEESLDTLRDLVNILIEIRPDLTRFLLTIRDEAGKPSDRSFASAVFDLPFRLREKEDKDFVVIIDEFQTINQFEIYLPDVIRQKIQQQKGVYYYIAGSVVSIMADILNRADRPLFVHFDTVRVGYFSYEDARQFVLKILGEQGILCNERLLNFLVSFSGGFPFFMRVILDQALVFLQPRRAKHLTEAVLIESIKATLFDKAGVLYTYFRETLDITLARRESGRFFQILKAVALDRQTTTAIAKSVGLPPSSLPQYLRELLEMELLVKKDRQYQVKDNLTRFWLAASYAAQESSILDVKQRLDIFTEKTAEALQAFKQELGIAREAQIRETLVASGGYNRVIGGYLAGVEFDVIARGQQQLLLGEIKTGNVTAADVTQFVKKVKLVSQTEPVKEKVMFALMGITETARQKAKKYTVQLWDLKTINAQRRKYQLTPIRL